MSRGYRLLSVCLCAVAATTSAHGFVITDSTGAWSAVNFPVSPSYSFDAAADQQTGQGESDLVGDSNHPVLYRYFDNGSTPNNHLDGTLYFRARLNGSANKPGQFGDRLFIGLEANGDGKLDLFLSANAKGGNNAIYGAGNSANISPSTTSLTGSPLWSLAHSDPAARYVVQTASAATDSSTPLVTDVGGNGATDLFVSFGLPISVIAQYMASSAGITMDDTTPLRYALATATQDNAINQDVNGVGKNAAAWDTPWASFMNPAIASVAVPEPGITMLIAGVMLAASWLRPQREAEPQR